MAARHDLVIRGGLVVDGSGSDGIVADVAVDGGVIVAVGQAGGTGVTEIDATGLLVTPGFIDPHTHYDGQAIWSERLNPSSSHGVTTAVMGNCGVGFAPCRPADRELLCATMEGVEDIPGVVMKEGLTWAWESFPEYLNEVEARARDIDVAAFVPHSPVRVYAMGERGARREAATSDDLAQMARIVREAVAAGALGFASSRTNADRRSDGELVPSFNADERELVAAAMAVEAGGGGVIQIITELGLTGLTPQQEFKLLEAVSTSSDQPVTYTLAQGNKCPEHWLGLLELTNEHNRRGGSLIHPQYFPRPIGMLAGLDLTSNPFVHCPSYKAIAHLPLAERVAEMRKPDVRARIVSEEPDDALMPLTALTRQFAVMYPLSNPPDYEPAPESSILAAAHRQGQTPQELAYDLLLEKEGRGTLFVAISNYSSGSLEHLAKFFGNPHAVMGLGDGGAHYGLVCDSGYPTFVLSYWARDRTGWRLSLGQAVKAMTSSPAELLGLRDRGRLAPGHKADINVIDHLRLTAHAPHIVDDLPGGGRRLDQLATGYRWTFVSGVAILKDDQPTGALPGRLVRGKQAALVLPVEAAA